MGHGYAWIVVFALLAIILYQLSRNSRLFKLPELG